MITPSFRPIAGHAVLVELATEISEEVADAIVSLDRAIQEAGIEGVRETTPALVNLLVIFDPLVTDHAQVGAAVSALLPLPEKGGAAVNTREVDVCYEDGLCPDLDAVAQPTGGSHESVSSAHLAADYRVGMYGFAPGFAYLAGVPEGAQVPRKPAPVRGIPAGSVMVAGPQCIVTTVKMPTGWSIIGRSPTQIMLSDPDKPFLFDVGDRVQFRRISRDDYERAVS
ncbi:MAG: allophanate hydrolase subunit 1 [Litoreibacter sp.]|nr:allophanate hydrolase subunit 1 [Litoreibacter sp.]